MKRAYCSACGGYVELSDADVCPGGHPRSCYRGVQEIGVAPTASQQVAAAPVAPSAAPAAPEHPQPDWQWPASETAAITQPPSAEGGSPVGILPPASGFWRRFAAFLLDGVLLGLLGQALALSAPDLWFQLGPYGRFLGEGLALLYFAVLDSRIAKGQTLGKRLLGVAVRDGDGEAIGLGRSALRTLIWLVPASLNQWALPAFSHPIASAAVGIVLFGVGGAVVVTMIFNRRSRQGLHDMLTRSYVVDLKAAAVSELPTAARLQWILSGVMLGLAVALAIASGIVVPKVPILKDVAEIHAQLQKDDRFFSFSVVDQTIFESGRDEEHVLVIRGWYRGRASDAERTRLLTDIAAVALTMKNIERFNLVRVDVYSCYDLGIASGNVYYGDGQSVETWRNRVAER